MDTWKPGAVEENMEIGAKIFYPTHRAIGRCGMALLDFRVHARYCMLVLIDPMVVKLYASSSSQCRPCVCARALVCVDCTFVNIHQSIQNLHFFLSFTFLYLRF